MKIHPLPPEVISKLRSGVAITSVAHCVEELVLNSVDAGATSIAVRLNLPFYKIQVVDNGEGILPEQLQLVGERYATSKCHSVEDLSCRQAFYGYRGEALASLCDMSTVVEIESRTSSSNQTFCKIFTCGKPCHVSKILNHRPSVGTTVTVLDFMYNMPVRKRAISEILDLEFCRQYLECIALIHPLISFSLRNDVTGEKILQTRKSTSTCLTFSHLFGHDKATSLKELLYSQGECEVSGYISTSGHTSKQLQFLYINKRLVLKTKLHKLINSVLNKHLFSRQKHSSLNFPNYISSSPSKTQEHFSIFILKISCPFDIYDITLEPRKTLVEFQDWDIIVKVVENALMHFLKENNLLQTPVESNDIHSQIQAEPYTSDTKNSCSKYGRQITSENTKNALFSLPVKRIPFHFVASDLNFLDSAKFDEKHNLNKLPFTKEEEVSICKTYTSNLCLTTGDNALMSAVNDKVAKRSKSEAFTKLESRSKTDLLDLNTKAFKQHKVNISNLTLLPRPVSLRNVEIEDDGLNSSLQLLRTKQDKNGGEKISTLYSSNCDFKNCGEKINADGRYSDSEKIDLKEIKEEKLHQASLQTCDKFISIRVPVTSSLSRLSKNKRKLKNLTELQENFKYQHKKRKVTLRCSSGKKGFLKQEREYPYTIKNSFHLEEHIGIGKQSKELESLKNTERCTLQSSSKQCLFEDKINLHSVEKTLETQEVLNISDVVNKSSIENLIDLSINLPPNVDFINMDKKYTNIKEDKFYCDQTLDSKTYQSPHVSVVTKTACRVGGDIITCEHNEKKYFINELSDHVSAPTQDKNEQKCIKSLNELGSHDIVNTKDENEQKCLTKSLIKLDIASYTNKHKNVILDDSVVDDSIVMHDENKFESAMKTSIEPSKLIHSMEDSLASDPFSFPRPISSHSLLQLSTSVVHRQETRDIANPLQAEKNSENIMISSPEIVKTTVTKSENKSSEVLTKKAEGEKLLVLSDNLNLSNFAFSNPLNMQNQGHNSPKENAKPASQELLATKSKICTENFKPPFIKPYVLNQYPATQGFIITQSFDITGDVNKSTELTLISSPSDQTPSNVSSISLLEKYSEDSEINISSSNCSIQRCTEKKTFNNVSEKKIPSQILYSKVSEKLTCTVKPTVLSNIMFQTRNTTLKEFDNNTLQSTHLEGKEADSCYSTKNAKSTSFGFLDRTQDINSNNLSMLEEPNTSLHLATSSLSNTFMTEQAQSFESSSGTDAITFDRKSKMQTSASFSHEDHLIEIKIHETSHADLNEEVDHIKTDNKRHIGSPNKVGSLVTSPSLLENVSSNYVRKSFNDIRKSSQSNNLAKVTTDIILSSSMPVQEEQHSAASVCIPDEFNEDDISQRSPKEPSVKSIENLSSGQINCGQVNNVYDRSSSATCESNVLLSFDDSLLCKNCTPLNEIKQKCHNENEKCTSSESFINSHEKSYNCSLNGNSVIASDSISNLSLGTIFSETSYNSPPYRKQDKCDNDGSIIIKNKSSSGFCSELLQNSVIQQNPSLKFSNKTSVANTNLFTLQESSSNVNTQLDLNCIRSSLPQDSVPETENSVLEKEASNIIESNQKFCHESEINSSTISSICTSKQSSHEFNSQESKCFKNKLIKPINTEQNENIIAQKQNIKFNFQGSKLSNVSFVNNKEQSKNGASQEQNLDEFNSQESNHGKDILVKSVNNTEENINIPAQKSIPSKTWVLKKDPVSGKNIYINVFNGNSSYTCPEDFQQDKKLMEGSIHLCSSTEIEKSHFFLSHNASPFMPRPYALRNFKKHKPADSFSKGDVKSAFPENVHSEVVKQEVIDVDKKRKDNESSSGRIVKMLKEWENPVFQKNNIEEVTSLFPSQNFKTAVQSRNFLEPCCFSKAIFKRLEVIGQVDCKFIVCLIKSEDHSKNKNKDHNMVVLFDQHAVHERIRLEQLINELYEEKIPGDRSVKSSIIHPPLILKMRPEETSMLKAYQSRLIKLGISVSTDHRNPEKLAIKSVPVCLLEREANELKRHRQSVTETIMENILRDWLLMMQQTGGANTTLPKTLVNILNSQACHGAIKFGDTLNSQECCHLIHLLSCCKLPFQCAHGRPSVVSLINLDHLNSLQEKNEQIHLWKISEAIAAIQICSESS